MFGPSAVAVACVFVWLGMVLAISFMEAPLKFRAPGVTLAVGPGHRPAGVSRSQRRGVDTRLGGAGGAGTATAAGAGGGGGLVAVVALTAQLLAVRPRLTPRSDAVLAGEGANRRSRATTFTSGLEVIKVIALLVSGILLLAA